MEQPDQEQFACTNEISDRIFCKNPPTMILEVQTTNLQSSTSNTPTSFKNTNKGLQSLYCIIGMEVHVPFDALTL